MRRVTRLSLAFGACLLAAAVAHADPAAFVVNERAGSISVVNVNAGTTSNTFSTHGTSPSSSGLSPVEAVYDAKSGRLFVAGDNRLMGWDARLPDGLHGVSETLAQANPTCLALDEVGRRVFMTHEDLGTPHGLVTEFSLANPLNPVATQRTVTGMPNLVLAAWDAKYRRLYVVDRDGRVARTGPGNWTFSMVTGEGATLAAGIIGDPKNGGVWITARFPGRLVHITEAGTRSSFELIFGPGAHSDAPRGMSWDLQTPSVLLVALEDLAQIIGYNTATPALTFPMATGPSPVDVAPAVGGKLVSANRVGSHMDGTVTIGPSAPVTAPVGEGPVALVMADLPRLTSDPASAQYCYNANADTSEKSFTIQNTRLDRSVMTLDAPVIGGANPANYLVTATNCTSRKLAWAATCAVSVRFTAGGPSNGGGLIATWPAELQVKSGTAPENAVKIPLRAQVSVSTCPTNLPTLPPRF